MNGGVCLAIEVDEARARRRLDIGYVDRLSADPAEALGVGARGGGGRPRRIGRPDRQRGRDRAGLGRGGRAVRRRDRSDVGPRRPRRLRPGGDRARRRAGPPPDPARRVRPPVDGLDGRPRPGDARVPGRRRGRLRLRQQPPCPGPGGRRRERLRLPGLRPGVHPAAVLRGPRAVPLGRAQRRPGGHRPHRRRDPRAVPRGRGPPPLAGDGRVEGPVPGPARADLLARLRRAGAGRPRRSTSSSPRARSARRS